MQQAEPKSCMVIGMLDHCACAHPRALLLLRGCMPSKPPVHRPTAWRDKRRRDLDYAIHRDRSSLSLLKSKAWRKERLTFLSRFPRCVSCSRPATVVDHLIPHRGLEAAFWDRTRWQPLCASCHSRKTAMLDGGFGNPPRPGGWGVKSLA
jgi:5-methylcytosine-specific restriction protein A